MRDGSRAREGPPVERQWSCAPTHRPALRGVAPRGPMASSLLLVEVATPRYTPGQEDLMPQAKRRTGHRSGVTMGRRAQRRRRTTYGVVVLIAVLGILLFALSSAVSTAPTPSPSAMSWPVTAVLD